MIIRCSPDQAIIFIPELAFGGSAERVGDRVKVSILVATPLPVHIRAEAANMESAICAIFCALSEFAPKFTSVYLFDNIGDSEILEEHIVRTWIDDDGSPIDILDKVPKEG